MHKYPQNSTYVGSSGQTLTTNVSMTLCNWQFRHQTQVLCGCITFVLNQIRYQIYSVPAPAVAWRKMVESPAIGPQRQTYAQSQCSAMNTAAKPPPQIAHPSGAVTICPLFQLGSVSKALCRQDCTLN